MWIKIKPTDPNFSYKAIYINTLYVLSLEYISTRIIIRGTQGIMHEPMYSQVSFLTDERMNSERDQALITIRKQQQECDEQVRIQREKEQAAYDEAKRLRSNHEDSLGPTNT